MSPERAISNQLVYAKKTIPDNILRTPKISTSFERTWNLVPPLPNRQSEETSSRMMNDINGDFWFLSIYLTRL